MIDNCLKKKKQICVVLGVLFGIVLIMPILSCKSDIIQLATDRVLKDISDKYGQIKSYEADFVVVDFIEGKKDIIEGKIKFKRPYLMRQEMNISFNDGEKNLIISNGRIKWMYMPSIKTVFIKDSEILDKKFQKRYGITSSYIDIRTINYVKTDNLDGRQVYILEGMPNKIVRIHDPEALEKMKIFVDIETGIVRKVVSYDKQGKEKMFQIFRNFEFNVEIADSEFIFVPPEGTQVIDI